MACASVLLGACSDSHSDASSDAGSYAGAGAAAQPIDWDTAMPDGGFAPRQCANEHGEVDAGELRRAASGRRLAIGEWHSCLIRDDGEVICWGANTVGQSATPPGPFRELTAAFNTCGIRADGSLACWGDDTHCQSTPPLGTYERVSTYGQHACAIAVGGQLVCWGANPYGQSEPPSGIFVEVVVSNNYGCAVSAAGEAGCWGGSRWERNRQRIQPPPEMFTRIEVMEDGGCGVTHGGDLRCWGFAGNLLGDPVNGTGPFRDFSVGNGGTCAIVDHDGSIVCEEWHQFGTPPEGDFVEIAASTAHACALTAAGEVVCWGADEHGQASPPEDLL